MILQATENAMIGLLQAAVDDAIGFPGGVPVIRFDEIETKPIMPYIVIRCVDAEEQITPGSGIFKVSGELFFRSLTKGTPDELKESVLNAINNFAYDSTAAKLSATNNFHCHGWYPTTASFTVDDSSKSSDYLMKYWVYCMAMDDA